MNHEQNIIIIHYTVMVSSGYIASIFGLPLYSNMCSVRVSSPPLKTTVTARGIPCTLSFTAGVCATINVGCDLQRKLYIFSKVLNAKLIIG